MRPSSKEVYNAILAHLSRVTPRRTTTLAALTGFSASAVRRHLLAMEGKKMVIKDQKKDGPLLWKRA